MILARVIAIVLGYIFGLFQTGVIYGKVKHRDLRKEGSGNTGMTNSIRVMGWKAGAIVLAGDLFKAVIPMVIMWLVYRNIYPEMEQMLMLYAGLGAILGHNYPFYLGFKGGKGISCTVGIICAFHPIMVPICFLLFMLVVAPTGYMSLGSLMVALSFFVQVVIFGQLGLLRVGPQFLTETYILAAIVLALAVIRHKANIVRLIHGEENKFTPKKSKEKEIEER